MSFRHSMNASLCDNWLPLIERQYDLTLSPLSTRFLNAHVRFEEVFEDHASSFKLELSGKAIDGQALFFSGQHTDGRVLIADVFARARRDIGRRRRTQMFSWAR